jgi:iron complex outermembrane receptor protein
LKNEFRVKNFRIGSFYIEDSFNINEKNLLIAGINYNSYKFYGQENKNRLNLRAGVITFINHSFMIKGFVSRYYTIPPMISIETSKNNRLEPMKINSATAETNIYLKKNKFKLFFGYYRISNLIKFNRLTYSVENSGQTENFHEYGFSFSREFNPHISIKLNYWFTDVGRHKYTPDRGGCFRLMGDFNNLQIASSLVYRGDYKPYGVHIEESFNMDLSLTYKLPEEWYLKIKGENLLNRGEKEAVSSIISGVNEFSVNERKIYITLEKVF